MAISAKDVSDLRAKTGVGMMECKKALVETNGNMDEAIKLLRERGLAVAAKKADRVAADGIVDILHNTKSGKAVMIEVNAETDFVAKNDDFIAFVKGCLETVINTGAKTVSELLEKPYLDSGITVDAMLKEKILTIGENMSVRRFATVDGVLSTYIHGKGSIGVIIKFDADEKALAATDFDEFAKNIALQVAAITPLYLDRASVPADVIASEKEIVMNQIKNDPANEKKPANIVEKMAEGKIGKFFQANCLLEQGYVKDDALTVGAYVDSYAKAIGANVKINSFLRYEKGEGIEKRDDNFAEEIAMLTKN